ncbi:MAG: tRNA (adenosine(37)-N6)-threonylcarbamoyltransferase complex dimerization subunit type 1 TsaB [Bacillota bacterium]
MKILAVDTASSTASVAVLSDGLVIGEFSINNKNTHSVNLMPMISELMKRLGLAAEDIDYYAVSVGPGSFTGLRIGISVIKGIAYSVNKPVVAVSTLDALAHGSVERSNIICPMMDARNNQVFTAIYTSDGSRIERISEYLVIEVGELLQMLKEYDSVVFKGDGASLHENTIKEMKHEGALFAKTGNNLNRAVDVSLLAKEKILKNESIEAAQLKAFYLRKSQAEQQMEKKCPK